MSYLVSSGYEQAKILSDREPIEKLLKRKDLPVEQRKKFELALEVSQFAAEKLKLKATNNYKTYVDLKRPYVSYIVTVAEKYKLESRLYWYPLVGKLPYKGFFNKADAESEAKNFDAKKYDVMVRGVSAYSSLGWFDDPLLSTMLSGKDHHLVNLIFHESTHSTLYFKSQADFNEQLATFIGGIATEIYYLEKEGTKSISLKQIHEEDKDDRLFSEFISSELKILKKWYEDEKNITLERRELRFKEIQDKFSAELLPRLKTKNYDSFAKIKLNNAILLYYKTYVFDLNDFSRLYKHFNNDFSAFFNFCKSLEKNSDPHQAIKIFLSSAAAAPKVPSN